MYSNTTHPNPSSPTSQFYAHRSVLASGSDFFANYLGRWVEAEQKVIEINSVESVPLATIINFLYTGILDVNTNNMFNLFIAADKLQVYTTAPAPS